MERLIEGTVGQPAEVWVQDRGGGQLRLRGTVVIEDLGDVLTNISARAGANGPQNPVTQYILAQAADHLAARLTDGNPHADRETVPRMLSSSLGHQPFIEQVLQMSQHQMLRRWPLASDWYTDVMHYIMRPSRFDAVHRAGMARFEEWASGTLGDLLQQFGRLVVQGSTDPAHVVRLAEALHLLWPDYAPVRSAVDEYARQVRELWVPLYLDVARRYGLRIRPGVDPGDLAWAFNALQARETIETLGGRSDDSPLVPGGPPWNRTSRGILFLVAGTVTDLDGRSLSTEELLARRPVVTP